MKKPIYTIVAVIGLFVACQLIADVGATRFVEIAGVVMPGGTFVFAVTFTLRDMIHKRLGKEWARAAILTAAALNLFMSLYFAFIGALPVPGFFAYGGEWSAIFALVPAIVFGSIIAEVVSGLVDTEVYHRWWQRFPNAPQWTRVLVSNAVALPIDTIVFSLAAFVILPAIFGGNSLSLGDALLRVASGQMLYKALVAFVSIPLIYTVPDEPIELAPAVGD